VDVVLELLDAASRIWRPTLSAGALVPGDTGVVITAKAADDLGVTVGDTIVLRHPRRVALRQLQQVDTPFRVAGIDPNPIRVYAYMDQSRASAFGLAGATNLVNVEPAPGADIDALKRSILGTERVASVERVAAASEALSDSLTGYTDILRVVEAVALALALLIAFNSASIAADERAREYATMFAYGVPLRTVLRNAMAEGGVAGVLATAVGVGAGLLVIHYIVKVTTPRVLPELGATVAVSAGTIVLAAALGIIATAVAPVLTARKLSRMDVPSTLRVVE
jgi:putative ABC transport system permease protein